MNATRPGGKPKVMVEGLISADEVADAWEEAFRQCVEFWYG
jgi:hypothetical protein